MTKPRSELKNMSASVHARLLSFAKKERRDFNQVLTQFFQERLLDRLARSRYDEQFALKGALLFVALDKGSAAVRSRPTKDIGAGPRPAVRLGRLSAQGADRHGAGLVRDRHARHPRLRWSTVPRSG